MTRPINKLCWPCTCHVMAGLDQAIEKNEEEDVRKHDLQEQGCFTLTILQSRELWHSMLQGPYVLVFLNSGSSMKNKISPGWLAACYRQMSYPFRKNVKFVILVRPSAGLKFMLAIIRPLVSPKAFVKVKKVGSRKSANATLSQPVRCLIG